MMVYVLFFSLFDIEIIYFVILFCWFWKMIVGGVVLWFIFLEDEELLLDVFGW